MERFIKVNKNKINISEINYLDYKLRNKIKVEMEEGSDYFIKIKEFDKDNNEIPFDNCIGIEKEGMDLIIKSNAGNSSFNNYYKIFLINKFNEDIKTSVKVKFIKEEVLREIKNIEGYKSVSFKTNENLNYEITTNFKSNKHIFEHNFIIENIENFNQDFNWAKVIFNKNNIEVLFDTNYGLERNGLCSFTYKDKTYTLNLTQMSDNNHQISFIKDIFFENDKTFNFTIKISGGERDIKFNCKNNILIEKEILNKTEDYNIISYKISLKKNIEKLFFNHKNKEELKFIIENSQENNIDKEIPCPNLIILDKEGGTYILKIKNKNNDNYDLLDYSDNYWLNIEKEFLENEIIFNINYRKNISLDKRKTKINIIKNNDLSKIKIIELIQN